MRLFHVSEKVHTVPLLCPLLALRPPPHRRHQADSLREAFIGVDMTYVINAAEIECDYHRPIGSGGFAQVFRGVYKGMDVAVKVIHSSLMQSMDR